MSDETSYKAFAESELPDIAPINLEYFENKKRNDRKTYTNACFDDSPSVLNPNKTEEQPRPSKSMLHSSSTLCLLLW